MEWEEKAADDGAVGAFGGDGRGTGMRRVCWVSCPALLLRQSRGCARGASWSRPRVQRSSGKCRNPSSVLRFLLFSGIPLNYAMHVVCTRKEAASGGSGVEGGGWACAFGLRRTRRGWGLWRLRVESWASRAGLSRPEGAEWEQTSS